MSEPTATTAGANFLVTRADGLLTSLRITDGQTTVKLARDPGGAWNVVLPRPGETDPARAGAAELQVMSLRVISAVEAELQPDVIGIDRPRYIIELTFDNGTERRIEVGDVTPTGSGYYVRLDGDTIYVVSIDAIDALANLLTAPPYPATATQVTPTATETPVPLTPSETLLATPSSETPAATPEATPSATP